MATTSTSLTAEQFLALGEYPNGRREQLIDGEVVVTEATQWHQDVGALILVRLFTWIEAGTGRGRVSLPVDVGITGDSVFAPDVSWWREGRPVRMFERPQVLPDLAVEVRSPSTWRYDVGRKKALYEEVGLSELWLVDHASVLVFRRSAPRVPNFDLALELAAPELLTTPLLPGFALDLAELPPAPARGAGTSEGG